MKKLMMIAAAAGLVLACSAHAADAEKAKALAQSKNCLACHAVDKKLVGPAYTEVSKKYKGNKDAEAGCLRDFRIQRPSIFDVVKSGECIRMQKHHRGVVHDYGAIGGTGDIARDIEALAS